MPCLVVLGILGALFLLLVTCNSDRRSAPESARAKHEREEMIATAINLSGNLCAKVLLVSPRLSTGEHQVNCEEYRDPRKSGTKKNMVIYLVNPDEGTVKLMGRA